MTREHAKQLLPIITAFAEGKKIECKFTSGDWVEAGDLAFDSCPEFYRIKPEPRRFWIVGSAAFSDEQIAAGMCKAIVPNQEIIEVVEVLK